MPLDEGRAPASTLSPTTTPGSGAAALAPKENKQLDDLQKSHEGKLADLNKQLDESAAAARQRTEKIAAEGDKLKPPEFKTVPYQPPQPTSLANQWGSLAMTVAALGSLFVRRHATAALDAATAVMNGFHANDQAAQKLAYDQWKVNNENTLQAINFQQKQYEIAMRGNENRERLNRERSSDEQASIKAKIAAEAASFKDNVMLERLRQGGIAAAEKEYDRREKEKQEYEKRGIELSKEYEKRKRVDAAKLTPEYKAAEAAGDRQKTAEILGAAGDKDSLEYLKATKPSARAGAGADPAVAKRLADLENDPEYQAADQRKKAEMRALAGDTSAARGLTATKSRTDPSAAPLTEAEEKTAQAIANYAVAPPTPGRQNYPRLMGRVLDLNPEYQGAQYGNATLAERNWINPNGTGAKQIQSFTRAAQHLETISKLADALDNGDFPLFNRIANQFQISTGGHAVTDFNTAKQIVGAEIVKATAGTPGGVGEREDVRGALDAASSPAQLKGAIETTKDLIGGALESAESMYIAGTKKSRADFLKLLPDETRRYFAAQLEKKGGSSNTPASAAKAEEKATATVPAPQDRETGKVYQTPRGPMKWMGNGWAPANG